MRKKVLYQSGNPAYNMEHHAVVAWDAIRRHLFMDATDEASRCENLEIVLNLDHTRLLAKVVATLRDVLRPLQQRLDAGQSAKQSPTPSICDVNGHFNHMVPVKPMHIQEHGFQVLQHSQHPFQNSSAGLKRQSQRPGITDRRFTGPVNLIHQEPIGLNQALCFSV